VSFSTRRRNTDAHEKPLSRAAIQLDTFPVCHPWRGSFATFRFCVCIYYYFLGVLGVLRGEAFVFLRGLASFAVKLLVSLAAFATLAVKLFHGIGDG